MTKKRLGDRRRGALNVLAPSTFRCLRAPSGHPGRRGSLALVLAVAGLTVAAPLLMARKEKPPTTKTVRGQVLDSKDNGIVGAAVEMTDLTTGKKSAIYTEQGGQFTFSGLKTFEDYSFRATNKGRTSETRKVSSWDTRMRLVVNLHIPPPKD